MILLGFVFIPNHFCFPNWVLEQIMPLCLSFCFLLALMLLKDLPKLHWAP